MFSEYQEKRKEFDKLIQNYFSGSEFSEVLNYSIETGKRIRPLLLLETFKMLNLSTRIDLAEKYALALEMIHNYSLIHDDLPSMDNDNYRRGRETTHYKFGEDIAILAGDSLLNYAYELIFETLVDNADKKYILAAKYLANASGIDGMIIGQVDDIKDQINNLDDIVTMYKNKTCKLIMAATTMAGYISGADKETLSELENLGFYIGMAFQIQDDILDYEQDQEIDKVTYISFTGKEKAYSDMIEYSNKAISIINKYDDNQFLLNFIEKLVNRDK